MISKEYHDLIVIGGGPAGLASALAAYNAGCNDIVIIEREGYMGGILNQCIHDGFGLHKFSKQLSGPEYSSLYIKELRNTKVRMWSNSMVINLRANKTLRVSKKGEIKEIQAKAIILAMGCRERSRGAISIPGHRPAGVYTAGMVQTLVNMENIMPGKDICILGSGDIGLIMARRLTLEGANVKAVFEIQPNSSGLQRNIQQCLRDFKIPLYLGTTITNIYGSHGKLKGITIAQVDMNRNPIMHTERFISCDTLLLSVGLIPENELSREAGILINGQTQGPITDKSGMTSIPGVFACGNVLHVHDLVDNVSTEAAATGQNAVRFINGQSLLPTPKLITINRENLPNDGLSCIICPKGCAIKLKPIISGFGCERGLIWAKQELAGKSLRNFSSSIMVLHGNYRKASVRTSCPVLLSKIPTIMNEIQSISKEAPLKIGQIILEHPAGTDANIIITRNVERLK